MKIKIKKREEIMGKSEIENLRKCFQELGIAACEAAEEMRNKFKRIKFTRKRD